jgi:hypothetical protein
MTAPFAAVLERPEEETAPRARPLLHGDFRFCHPLEGTLPIQQGDPADSAAAPFARFVSKTSHPMTGEGPTIFASAVTDRATRCSGAVDDNQILDT